jgi:hypothetical protein
MNLNANKSRLASITRELALQWEQTKNYWRDQKSEEFEKKYLQELFLSSDRAGSMIEKLDELLKKVRTDCE